MPGVAAMRAMQIKLGTVHTRAAFRCSSSSAPRHALSSRETHIPRRPLQPQPCAARSSQMRHAAGRCAGWSRTHRLGVWARTLRASRMQLSAGGALRGSRGLHAHIRSETVRRLPRRAGGERRAMAALRGRGTEHAQEEQRDAETPKNGSKY